MKKDIDLTELRALIRSVLEEDMSSGAFTPPSASALLNHGPQARKSQPPPLPGSKPASAALPQKGALNKFKADVNMAVDAANRVKQNVEQANTKEALRWLDKMIAFAQSAKTSLGTK